MRSVVYAFASVILAMQPSFSQEPLVSVAAIELPGVSGRIDHLAFEAACQRLFVAALGNNTVEALDVKVGKHPRSLPSLREPQGIAVVPDTKLIAVANGQGDGVQFVSDDYRMVQAVRLGDDSDNVRYDAARKRVYVIGGAGYIDVFQGDEANRLTRIARVPTAAGARTGLFVPELNRLFLAVPHRGSQRAEIRVYEAR